MPKDVKAVSITVPSWIVANADKPGYFDIDPDGFYPDILKQFEDHPSVPYDGKVDQYWLECAYQCMKLTVQFFLGVTGLDPRPQLTLNLNVKGKEGSKKRWGQKNHPEGLYKKIRAENGPLADRIVGGQARNHFKAMKGFIPQ